MADLPAVLGAIAKNEGVLHALYSDLAAPGVRQVGVALETVLKTGSILLMPLRMLNEYAAAVERKNFEEIADRFKSIPEEDVIDVSPEIGSPILDKLSITRDPDLRKLFIELLACAADRRAVPFAHPSFVRVIESLSPDEAKMIAEWKERSPIPCLMIGVKTEDGSNRLVYDPYLEVPDSVGSPNFAAMYVANLAGLGLVVHHDDRYVTSPGAYDYLIEEIKKERPQIKEDRILFRGQESLQPGEYFYKKGCLSITPYGKAFQRACMQ